MQGTDFGAILAVRRAIRHFAELREKRQAIAALEDRIRELEGRILAAFDQEPLAPGAQAVVSGRWKKVREGGEVWLFDLWQDPLRGMSKVQAQRPAAVPPEILEKMRREGYW